MKNKMIASILILGSLTFSGIYGLTVYGKGTNGNVSTQHPSINNQSTEPVSEDQTTQAVEPKKAPTFVPPTFKSNPDISGGGEPAILHSQVVNK